MSEFSRVFNGTVAELERRQTRIAELEQQVAELRSQVIAGVYDGMAVGMSIVKTDLLDELRKDAERWVAVMQCLGGSTIRHEDGRTYFAVVVPFHVDDRDEYETTANRFVRGIDQFTNAQVELPAGTQEARENGGL
jgi:hypothetical protein